MKKPQTLQLTLILIILFTIGAFMIFSEKGRSIIKKYVLRGYSKKFKGFSKSLYNYLGNYKKEVLLNYIVTSIRVIVDALIIYILFASFSIILPLFWIIVIRAIIVIISLIPLTPSGLGIRESIGVYLFSRLNVDIGITTTVFIFILIIIYLTAGISIASLMKKEDLNFKK